MSRPVRTIEINRPDVVSNRPGANLGGMDILAQVLDRVRLGGTLLFHFELGHPWHLELPARPYALFHYLSQGPRPSRSNGVKKSR